MILVGDIGGTNARLALFSDDGKQIVTEETLPSAAHASFGSAIDAFLAGKKPRLTAATFGIAGPVVNGRVKTTNLPWVVDERVLAKRLGLRRVTLLNDLVTLALGAIAAPKRELHMLQGKRPPGHSPGNVAVIAAGTGLGEAALIWDGARFVPCGTEGGHADFAPRSDLECELLAFIGQKVGGRVSYERVVSGPGLGIVYEFFHGARGMPEKPAEQRAIAEARDKNAAIALLGASGKSKACAAALSMFASLYGAEAGNLALKFLAVGGVFLAGKIASNLAPTLEKWFIPAFLDKGRMGPLLASMPVAIVKSSSVGLHGAARHAAGLV